MKKNFRQLLALFLCLVFVFSVLPTVAMAEGETVSEETQTEEDLLLNDDGDQIDKEKQTDGEDLIDGEKQTNGENLIDSEKQTDSENLIDGEKQTDGEVLSESSDWYVPVSYHGTEYEIEFYESYGESQFGPFSGAHQTYNPDELTGFSRECFFGVVTRTEPEQENGPMLLTLADPEIQAKITDLSFSFVEAQNEDGAAGQNWTFTPNTEARKVTISADSKKGFSGVLTASFKFDDAPMTLTVEVSYLRCDHYLSFRQDGSETRMNYVQLVPGTPMSGTLYLNSWSAADGDYTETPLTQADSENLSWDGAVSLSWEESGLVTLTPNGRHEFWIDYESDNIMAWLEGYVGNGGGNGGGHSNWYVPVSYHGTEYEIEFYESYGESQFGPFSGAHQTYNPDELTGFSRECFFGVVTRTEPEQENGPMLLTLADPEIQAKITDLSFSFVEAQNEDGAAGQNWTFTPNTEARKVTISADSKKGFSGVLTASFKFDDAPMTLTVEVSYLRCDHYLSFRQDGSETRMSEVWLAPRTPMSGTLYLNSWDAADRVYTETPLTQAEGDYFSCEGAVSLSWEQSGLATLTPARTGWFQINYSSGNVWASLNGTVSSSIGTSNWYVPVTVGDDSYEIEFYYRWSGSYYSQTYNNTGSSYRPSTQNAFSAELYFGVVTQTEDENGNDRLVPADPSIQAMITELDFSFAGQNEDGAAGQNWTFTPNIEARKVTISADSKKGFSGILTAAFNFDELPKTVSVGVNYLRDECYLTFIPAGSDTPAEDIHITLDTPLSGKLYLNLWDPVNSRYEVTPLTADALSQNVRIDSNNDSNRPQMTWDNSGQVTLTANANGSFYIRYEDSNQGIIGGINGTAGDGGVIVKDGIELTYNGEPVQVCFGFLQSNSLRLAASYGNAFHAGQNMPYEMEFVLGALKHYGDQAQETFADPEFFARILSCGEVEMELFSGTMPTASVPQKVTYSELQDGQLYTFMLTSEPDTPFDITMRLTFTYLEDDGETVSTYTVTATAFFRQTGDAFVNASDLNTAAKLNHVLESSANLAAYLIEHDIDFSWEGELALYLPAVEYDELIICNVGGNGIWSVTLTGKEYNHEPEPDDRYPTMHGILAKSGLGFLYSIDFVADEGVTQSYGDSTFTCGVLYAEATQSQRSIYAISGCSFSGFDYAVRSTAEGYTGTLSYSNISDCDYGLYIDCPDLNGAGNSEVCWNTFTNCGDAVYIAKLPWTITAYIYRIHDNSFINCGRSDISILDAGTYFCYGNYFGLSNDTRRSANIVEANGACVIANPCREDPYWIGSNRYWIDPAHRTQILISEADSLRISAEALNGERVTINVVALVNSSLNTVGIWTFGGTGA